MRARVHFNIAMAAYVRISIRAHTHVRIIRTYVYACVTIATALKSWPRVLMWPARTMHTTALCLFAYLLLGAVDTQGEVYDQKISKIN